MLNALAAETSSYLRQHAAQPVAWQAWNDAALTQAKTLNRPILLSIGYSACHWCHVMAHESFEDAEVAAVMNEHFINIKVDREERPDLDLVYQTAHQMLTGLPGGWPLTVALAPDGLPFFAGTYFPKNPRYGLPGFADLCRQLADYYHQQPDKAATVGAYLQERLAGTLPRARAQSELAAATVNSGCQQLLDQIDPRFGGFGDAPKFPQAQDLAFLLRQGVSGNAPAADAALNSLTAMAEGGLYDQLAGGFFRYSVDAEWQIPHFEKMLYDQGLLLPVYIDAWRCHPQSLFAAVVEQTVAWLQADMALPGGGFAASLDADADGEEGAYYVWRREEVSDALSADEWPVAQAYWGLHEPANFERKFWHLRAARSIPNRALGTEPLSKRDQDLLNSARGKLLARRRLRHPPHRDDKVLTAWNALLIGSLARASRVFQVPAWGQMARQTLDFVRTQLWQTSQGSGLGDQPGRLSATVSPTLVPSNGRSRAIPAYLDDYALLIQALLECLQTEFHAEDLAFAITLADTLLEQFEDKDAGGFYFTANDAEPLIHRPKPSFDNSLPNGNASAALALLRLGYLLAEPRYIQAAERTVQLFQGQIAAYAGGSWLTALSDTLAPPPIVILTGPDADLADLAVWVRATAQLPNKDQMVFPVGDLRQDLPPALRKPASSRVHAWICVGHQCQPAIDDLATLLQTLREF